MLQGTLDVFSLDEVLGLLSGANKSGVLNITGDRGIGSVSIADGQLVAGSASSSPEAVELADVVFELLRYQEGSFSFDGDAHAEGDPRELDAVMAEATQRLDEWISIETVVPSLTHHMTLAGTLSTTQVTLSESEWATIVAIGEGASVGVVAQRLGLGEFDGSKRVKSLIERSLATIEVGAPAQAAATFTEPVFATPEPTHTSFADVSPTLPDASLVEDAVPVASSDADFSAPAADAVEAASSAFDAVETEALEAPSAEPVADVAAEIATDFSFDAVPAEAPAFEDAPVAAFGADLDVPPMPEAPSFEPIDDAEIPPMPAPPARFAEASADIVPPAPMPPTPKPRPSAAYDALVGAEDMFELPRRIEERSTDDFAPSGFDAANADFDADTEFDAPAPPPPAATDDMPSFAPPIAFDAEAFPAAEESVAATAQGDASDGEIDEEKGGSLLMRYLKSNG